jgi:hypothetical protein
MSINAYGHRSNFALFVVLIAIVGLAFIAACNAREIRGGTRTSINGGGGVNRNANANVNRNVNVNRNTNVNVNRNVDVNVDNNWNHGMGGCCYHPVATAAAVTATVAVTAAVVGSMVHSVPATGCQTVVVNGLGYTQCGSTWYQPQYAGTQVTYVVVNPPG